MTKLKQLLVKTKKELAEGQRREEGLRSARTDLHTQLEEERQGSEQAKVEVAQFTAKIQSMKQQVGGAKQHVGGMKQQVGVALERAMAMGRGGGETGMYVHICWSRCFTTFYFPPRNQ